MRDGTWECVQLVVNDHDVKHSTNTAATDMHQTDTVEAAPSMLARVSLQLTVSDGCRFHVQNPSDADLSRDHNYQL